MDAHNEAVSIISAKVREFYEQGVPFRISKGSTNSVRPSTKIASQTVDISPLCHIISIDAEARTCTAEPNVPMDELVRCTLEYGLQPCCTPEFPGITVGGLYNGTCGESSSFKYGLTDRTFNWIEIILGDGEIVRASETDNSNLFNGAAESLGTLGITTLLQLRLVEAKKYVKLTYHPVYSVQEAIKGLKAKIEDYDLDYVDGVLFSPDSGVIMTGVLTDEAEVGIPIQTFSTAWDPWFYLHAQDCISTTSLHTELVPIFDYLFRWDRGAFWAGRLIYQQMGIPFNKYTRWLLDNVMHTRFLYAAVHAAGSTLADSSIVQDLALPYDTAENFIEYSDKNLGIWPLWLCPLKNRPGPTRRREGLADGPMLNIGLWGSHNDRKSAVAINKALEDELARCNGSKVLYSQLFYDEEAFWSLYDKVYYDQLRQQYKATRLPTIYAKTRRVVKPPTLMSRLFENQTIAGLYGILSATISGEGKRRTGASIKSKDLTIDKKLV